MPKRHVNIATKVNASKIRKEKRNGRDYIIVPSATLPDNIVMNGIMYPDNEIEASFMSLEQTPAPFGHPVVNGNWVSATSPEGINAGWIGAWNENVRRENGRVFLDKVIDVEVAQRTANGRSVLEAIEKQEPIHTSTALTCDVEEVTGKNYMLVAHNMEFDHDAILLDEPGAATPSDGVGIFVNSAGQTEEIQVVNSILEQTEEELDWAVDSIVRVMERRNKVPLYDRLKAAIQEVFTPLARAETKNEKEAEMSKEEFDKLSAKVDALPESFKTLGESIANDVGTAVANALKPLIDAQAEVANAQKAKDDTELAELVGKIVKANLLSEDVAKTLTLNAARELAKKTAPAQSAAPINGLRVVNGNGDGKSRYEAPGEND